MTQEHMLRLLSGEVTTTLNVKYSTVLVPKDTYRALTSNCSLHDTYELKKEEIQTGSALTCFNRRLHEINVDAKKLYVKEKNICALHL